MTAPKHCAGCQHWTPPSLRRDGRWGLCGRIATGYDTEVDPTTEGLPFIDNGASETDDPPRLRTPPDFGCTTHEPVGRAG